MAGVMFWRNGLGEVGHNHIHTCVVHPCMAIVFRTRLNIGVVAFISTHKGYHSVRRSYLWIGICLFGIGILLRHLSFQWLQDCKS